MIYLLALIGLVTLAVLLWKGFGPDLQRPAGRVVGPDDDPEFLWQVDRENHRRTRDTPDGDPQD
ncbi:hypothetical protein ACFWPA_07180 [Rhodococcus sp. NPDC058505]|uniref:hypothetical protein n=1 Tax=unclassified Rhodococcus (in: high G+C Gram-positive bacteria) TaxID=192944 RepID=UPI0036525F84